MVAMMFVHWKATHINPPLSRQEAQYATWTVAGCAYKDACREEHIKPHFVPGLHYEALPLRGRILMPDLDALHGLRHSWCWVQRTRPTVPIWSYAKMPAARWSPEENARLLSVLMRPWTLHAAEATEDNPNLWNLGRLCEVEGRTVPAWKVAPTSTP